MRLSSKWAAVGAGSLAAMVFAVPAHATSQSGSVVISLNTSGPSSAGRTLLLYDTAGQPLSALDLSSGTKSFVAEVLDSSYGLAGFTVQASMSNLYGYNNGTWSCTASIPSSSVSIATPSSLLDLSGLGSSLTPKFVVNGNLSSVLGSLVTTLGLSTATVTNAAVTGLGQTLSQSQLAGGATGQIIGSQLSTLAGDLPVQLLAGSGGAFANPAADPTGANCGQSGSSATQVGVMNGVSNTAGLNSDLSGVLSQLPSQSATTYITDGYMDSNSVVSAVATALGIPINLLSPFTSAIENTLTVSLASTPLTSGLTTESGTYASSPAMTVNTTGVPNGSYRGTLTITEVDN
jgi:hypothetical protein